MRILQLTHKFPYPYHDGGAIAVKSLANGLEKAGAEIDLFSLNTDKHFVTKQQIEEFKTQSVYNIVNPYPIYTTESKSGAIWNVLFGKESYFINRFYEAEIENELKYQLTTVNYDAVLIESLYMIPYFDEIRRTAPCIPVVLRAHNIEFELRSRQMEEERSWFRKIYLNSEIRKLKKYEIQAFSKVDLIATVSKRETEKIKTEIGESHIVTIPIGMPVKKIKANKEHSNIFKIGFIGSLDWRPNVNGLEWFVAKVWSQIKSTNGIHCSIAGAYAGKEIDFLKEKDLKYLGGVDSSKDFMESLDLLIVPLFSGSGTRVKILEAMSLGVPVLSTSLGAEGINIQPGAGMLIGDSVKDWVETILEFSKNPKDLISISENATNFIREAYNIECIGVQLKEAIEVVVSKKGKFIDN